MKTSILKYLFTPLFLLGFLSLLLLNMKSQAQNPNDPPKRKSGFVFDPERLVWGGNLGFQFGDVTLIDISPIVGYKFTDKMIGGLGITYQYFQDKRSPQTFSTSIYGGRIFGRYYMLEDLFAHVEYEILNYDGRFVDPYHYFNDSRITAHNFYIGAGYVLPISDNAGLNMMILYNLNENAESLYPNPVYRVGFTVGI